jgi:EF-P beta-lysylation protein EpmB
MIPRSPAPGAGVTGTASAAAAPRTGGAAAGIQAPAPRRAPWQTALRDAVVSVGELLDLLALDPALLPPGRLAARAFPLRVPRDFVARMRPGDPADPLLLQVLPAAGELAAAPGWSADPLDEAGASPVPGVLHKYPGRALLLVTGACGVHCRYCFRRHFPYAEHTARAAWPRAVEYLASDPTLHEVILSGGDPLALDDALLAPLAERLAAIPHLRTLRVHTRMPVVLPERVDEDLLAWLAGTRLQPVVVLHANHPRELDAAVAAAVARMRGAGALVLNQAVLLAGVNDTLAAQAELSHRLLACGALPYYLHQLDRVAGAAAFAVSDERALALERELRAALPGYLVPRLVRETPGAPGKVPLGELADGTPPPHTAAAAGALSPPG